MLISTYYSNDKYFFLQLYNLTTEETFPPFKAVPWPCVELHLSQHEGFYRIAIVCSFYNKIFLVRLSRSSLTFSSEGVIRMREACRGLHFTQNGDFLLGTHNYRTFVTVVSANTKRHICKFPVVDEEKESKGIKEQFHFYHYKTVSLRSQNAFLIAGVYGSGKLSVFNVLPKERRAVKLTPNPINLGENYQITSICAQDSALAFLVAERDLAFIASVEGSGQQFKIKSIRQINLTIYSKITEIPTSFGFSEEGNFAVVQCPRGLFIIRGDDETFSDQAELLTGSIDSNSRWYLKGRELKITSENFKEIISFQIQIAEIVEKSRQNLEWETLIGAQARRNDPLSSLFSRA